MKRKVSSIEEKKNLNEKEKVKRCWELFFYIIIIDIFLVFVHLSSIHFAIKPPFCHYHHRMKLWRGNKCEWKKKSGDNLIGEANIKSPLIKCQLGNFNVKSRSFACTSSNNRRIFNVEMGHTHVHGYGVYAELST